MAEPISSDPDLGPRARGRWRRALGGFASLALVLEIALALRVMAADAVEWYVRCWGPGRLCVFDDTNIYWGLAQAIRTGELYQYVEWSDIPHFAVRTPGYPLVLAACQSVFGEQTLPVRLVQAALGTLSVYLVYCLARQFVEPTTVLSTAPDAVRRRWTILLVAGAIAAVNPYYLLMSSLILSEAVFEPLMLASLLGLAVLWPARSTSAARVARVAGASRVIRSTHSIAGWKAVLVALGTGAASACDVLVRPSWAAVRPGNAGRPGLSHLRDRRDPDHRGARRSSARSASCW
jgi:hypothetical protein